MSKSSVIADVTLVPCSKPAHGDYADYMIVPTEVLALIPDELSAIEGASMMCAGISTYNALAHWEHSIHGNLLQLLRHVEHDNYIFPSNIEYGVTYI
jgi:D-arabinose 1-dehydrogenase-like Zn-dependent alcohol dehydrogenase